MLNICALLECSLVYKLHCFSFSVIGSRCWVPMPPTAFSVVCHWVWTCSNPGSSAVLPPTSGTTTITSWPRIDTEKSSILWRQCYWEWNGLDTLGNGGYHAETNCSLAFMVEFKMVLEMACFFVCIFRLPSESRFFRNQDICI